MYLLFLGNKLYCSNRTVLLCFSFHFSFREEELGIAVSGGLAGSLSCIPVSILKALLEAGRLRFA